MKDKNYYLYFLELIFGDGCYSPGNGEGWNSWICGGKAYNHTEMNSQKIYCCNSSPCTWISETKTMVCNGTMKSVDEKCYDVCPVARCGLINTCLLQSEICTYDLFFFSLCYGFESLKSLSQLLLH